MKYRHLISIICILLMGVISAFGQNNTITIPDVSVAKGKSISLPINMDNTADVVAIQFTLSVPNGLTLNTATATLSERSDEHSVTLQSVGNNKYMAMVFSSKNKAIKGRTGKLLSVSLTASNSLEEGTEHQLALSDVVIGARDGSNLVTGFNAGKVTIAKSPDLEVSQVVAEASNVNPGGKVNINWTVSNIGGLPTTGGWSEQILLTNEQGTTKLIGTVHNDEILNAGGIVSRNAELNIPAIIGMDGNCRVVVKLVPNSNAGEPSWLQENNISQTTKTISVKKQLSLSPDNANIAEATAKTIRFQLSRSGNTTNDEAFALTRNADSRIILPESITIEKGKSSTCFYAQVVANEILDNDSIVRFSISGDDYSEISSSIKIEDDTYPSLSISTTAQDVTEGGNIIFSVSTQRVSQSDIDVKMTCDFAPHFKIPTNIVIPAGQTSVEVNVEAIEDDVPNVEEVVTFTITAANHNPASVYTVLVDNDVPTLQLEITPTAVSEAAGPLAVTAKLRRIDNIDKVVTVKLSDDSEGGIYYGRQTIVLEKGVETATINLGPIDNAIVDAERTYNISAAVWIASCGCNANNGTSGGVVSVPLTVYDNDGPTLTMTSTTSVLNEGSEMTITVKRNTSATQEIVVYLSSDHDADIEYPSSVVIPSGKNEVSFTVKSRGNEITGDGFTATLSASSDGFATGNYWFSVSDQTLPDIVITSIISKKDSYILNEKMEFDVLVTNQGNAKLPASTAIVLYDTNSNKELTTNYTLSDLNAGESATLKVCAFANGPVGTHSYYVKANERKYIHELNYSNNSSSFATVEVIAPFTLTAEVEKSVYSRNEDIVIKGHAVGSYISDSSVEIYVINKGYRHVMNTKTDENGEYNIVYRPFEGQAGHFTVGACYPNENISKELCSFEMYGMSAKNNALKCDIIKSDTFNGIFTVKNEGNLTLNNVKASIISNDNDNCNITIKQDPVTIEGNQCMSISYSIKAIETSKELKYSKATVEFSSDEGLKTYADIYYYVLDGCAKLKADIANINTTIAIDTEREFIITLTNIGKNATGKITLAAPEWIKIANAQSLSSIFSGESTQLTLLLSSHDKMNANIPINGQIGINCENGDGITLPFSIEPVSTEIGTLSVDVCDEFTYYTEESPHVKGATVVVKHPTTGVTIAQGQTNSDGKYNIDLQEGYYTINITAPKHETYTNNVYVDPDRTKNIVVNLGYTAITYNWAVEETEKEDEYKIVTKVVYETNVPVPCVVLGVPERIDGDNMKAGESIVVYFTASNKGLITALNVTFTMPENTEEWLFEPLASISPFDLAAQQTVAIPVKITRLVDEDSNHAKSMKVASRANIVNNFQNCMAHVSADYQALCGEELKNNKAIERMALKMCGVAATGATIFDALSSLMGGISGGGGGSIGVPPGGNHTTHNYSESTTVISEQTFNMCDTCDASRAEKIIDFVLGKTWLGPVNEALGIAAQSAQDMRDTGNSNVRMRLTESAFEKLQDQIREQRRQRVLGEHGAEVLGWVDDIVEIIDIITEECPENSDDEDSNEGTNRPKSLGVKKQKSIRSWQEEYNMVAHRTADYIVNYDQLLQEFFGDKAWYLNDIEETRPLFSLLTSSEDVDIDQAMLLKPQFATREMVESLMERIHNTVLDIDSDNRIHWENVNGFVNIGNAIDEESIRMGYESIADQYQSAYDVCIEKYSELSSSVCASISLQFSQSMVMTRQAFRGTLTVFNGNESNAMTDVKLSLMVKDDMGNVATTHEFQINPESLNGFSGNLNLTDGWTLDAEQTGVATILFIPTKYAAPLQNRLYSFGGTLSYVDPFTGLTVTRDLTPITLTVKPSPNLDFTYFMQRDIKGDDPLTEEIEPCEEAEFSLLINNIGYGDATNVKMFTEQPKIVDNEKGLMIDFELMSSQLNGGEKTLALGGTVATDFGTIPAKSTSYAQWWIKSSLLGHFADYNVEATHVTSYGNPDLSLLNEVTIHELIRSLDVEDGNTKLVGFMTNDIVDADDMPDMLYLSNGEIESVSLVQDININKVSDTEYSMIVSTNQNGWNYGNIVDPTYGVSSLRSVVRQSDGKEMSLRNFWQTDRTLRDGKDPLYENRIHFVDNIQSANDETYILTFEPTPELLLEVASIEGVPEEGSLSVEPLNNIKVMFNKYIDPATFTTDDISLAVQGIKQDVSTFSISTDDNKTFMLDFSVLNENVGNGYFVLTINTSGIKDAEGYCGKNGKQAGWIMFRNGMVALNATTYPTSAGTIQKLPVSSNTKALSTVLSGEDCAEYGSNVKLTTVPNEGYEFKNWTINGEIVSSEPNLEYVALGDMNIKANYAPKTYSVNITDSNEGGAIIGAASGVYSYGDVLNLTAKSNEDYVFDGWEINNQNKGNDNDISIVVNESKDIKANFRRDVFLQSLTMSRGWNWVSSYVNEPIPISTFLGNVTHVVSQFDEIINDPVYGMIGGIETLLPGVSYKMDASYISMKSFKGHLHDLTNAPIELHTGWNWVSYPYVEEKDINDVLNSASEGDYMTSQFGFSEFADGYWEGTLNTLTPGYGYIYKSSTDKTMEFDFSNKTSKAKAMRASCYMEDSHSEEVYVRKYPSTMNIIARVYTGREKLDAYNCRIYAFAGNECRGESRNVGDNYYLTIYGDDATNITFVVENTTNGDTYFAKENVTFSQEVLGSRKNPFTITVAETNGINNVTDSSRKMKVYSVEGVLITPEATMETLKKLSRGIYIIDGQKFMVK